MDARPPTQGRSAAGAWTVALVVLLLCASAVATACGGASMATSSPSAAPPGAAVTPSATHWDYVVIGDSAFCAPDDITTVADAQARLIARDVGAVVSVDWYYYPGADSHFELSRLCHDETLRKAIRSAEVVLFDVPVGQLKEEVPWDDSAYVALPGSPARYREGMARMLPDYRRDAEAIVAEITSLRSPNEASIRAIDVWQLGFRGFRELGVGDVMRQAWRRMNRAVDEACAAHGVTVVDAYTAFVGPGGTRDPISAGDVLPDQMHLTDKGVAKLAKLLHEEGYAEVVPSP
jgi:hypothetical protein